MPTFTPWRITIRVGQIGCVGEVAPTVVTVIAVGVLGGVSENALECLNDLYTTIPIIVH